MVFLFEIKIAFNQPINVLEVAPLPSLGIWRFIHSHICGR